MWGACVSKALAASPVFGGAPGQEGARESTPGFYLVLLLAVALGRAADRLRPHSAHWMEWLRSTFSVVVGCGARHKGRAGAARAFSQGVSADVSTRNRTCLPPTEL